MLISIKQVLLVLAGVSWSFLTKQSIIEAFTLPLQRTEMTFHTHALYHFVGQVAFRERVIRQVREEQQWRKTYAHFQRKGHLL